MARRPTRDRHDGRPETGGKAKLRCAIYTRKSSDEGLEQSFNSLHAQRDACEAYVASQKHEGWVLHPEAYDDGGLSGGSMERPALKRLLDDIRSNRVDMVVVYKVDRLTRSLTDFAKLTDLFDRHGASFVSVTQHFNTSTSMGRLTLNVLLSFAQFEREVAGERIRDKIALSKRRGMWMGGLPPLGYDGVDGKLIVNEPEAETVRYIYRSCLETGSISLLKQKLDDEGIVSKRRIWKDGQTAGGVLITRGALYQILRNHLYRGEIAHRGEIHSGNHAAIIEPDLWDAVQEKLMHKSMRSRRNEQSAGAATQIAVTASSPLLAGLVFDGAGNRLTPHYTVKSGKRYGYYVSAPLVRGGSRKDTMRIPASDLESLVRDVIATHLSDPARIASLIDAGLSAGRMQDLITAGRNLGEQIHGMANHAGWSDDARNLLRSLISRIIVQKGQVAITIDTSSLLGLFNRSEAESDSLQFTSDSVTIEVPAHALRCGKQVRLVIGRVESEQRHVDSQLVDLIARARRWFDLLKSGRKPSIAAIAKAENLQASEVSRSLSLAFLSPKIVATILRGAQPGTLTIKRLRACRPLPIDWSEQHALLIGDGMGHRHSGSPSRNS